MLDAHVDALDDLLLAVDFVDLDTNGPLAHVPNLARAPVVKLVRHALLLRRAADNVHLVSHFAVRMYVEEVLSAFSRGFFEKRSRVPASTHRCVHGLPMPAKPRGRY